MSDKLFADSNEWIYLANDKAPEKKTIAIQLLNESAIISPQVLFECINVCR